MTALPQRSALTRLRVRALSVALSLLLLALLPGSALAAVSLTPATGGETISADTTSAAGGSGAWTTLTGPVVNGTAGDLDAGTITFTIDIAGAFEWRSGQGTASVSGPGCGTLAVSSGPSVSGAALSVTLSGDSVGTCAVTFSGLQVRPTAAGAAPLETSTITASGLVTGSAGTLTVVPGAPILTFTQGNIGDAVSQANLSPQPAVHSEDKFSNPRLGDPITLSIKPGTGTTGAVLGCANNTLSTDAGGNVTFSGCDIDKVGTGYRLVASTPGGTSAETNAFNITVGPASKLGFLSYPTSPSSSNLGTISVAVQDAAGNTVTSDTRTITLSISSNSGTFTCTGGLSKAAVSGVATFTGCTQTTVANGYTITASASGVTSVVGASFNVTSAAASRLAFCWGTGGTCTTASPTGVTGGVAFPTQPSIRVQDASGKTVTADNTTVVTLSIQPGTGASGAVLTCDGGLSKTVVAGVANYTGCRIDKASPTSPSNPYRLNVTAPGLTSAQSLNLVVGVGPAVKLGFTAQPNAGSVSQPFPIQPVVAVQDAGGNTVTSGGSSNALITLAIGTNPSGGVLTCSNGLTRQAVNGVATFSGCQIDRAGVGYTLTATAGGLTSATTSPFSITAPGASITLAGTATVIRWGEPVSFTIRFGANGANKTFVLEGIRDKATQQWTTIGTFSTNAQGIAVVPNYTPVTNLWYRARFAGTPDLGAGMSNEWRVVVRQLAVQSPRTPTSAIAIARGASRTISTTVRPARPELPKATVVWEFWRFSSGAWRLVTTRSAVIDSAGVARTTFRFGTSGQWRVRSRALPTPYNANSLPTPFTRYSVG